MKKLFFVLLLLPILAYLAYPYFYLYQLDQTLLKNDSEQLNQMVDLIAIKNHIRQSSNANIQQNLGQLPNQMNQFLQQGANVISDFAIEQSITLAWVRNQLLRLEQQDAGKQKVPSLIEQLDFAFFQSPISFHARIGQLGYQPSHIVMELSDWQWKIVAIDR